MGFVWNFPLFTIVLSLFSGVLCTVLSGKKAKIYTMIYEVILIMMTGAVLSYTMRTGQSFTYVMGEFPAPWGNEIRAGILEALMAVSFLVIMLCSVIAGGRYLKKDLDESRINLYFTLINLMTAALMSIIWTNDIFTGYVFLEILTLTSCGILLVREIGRTTLAAMRYMILNLLGSGLFLLGVVLLYDITGHLLMVNMHQSIVEIAKEPAHLPVLSIALGILTIGLAIKSGLFPFHFWMPDTYGRATPTSAAILSSLVSKAYILLLFKIYYRVVGMEVLKVLPLNRILLILGMCGIIFGSFSAIRARNINRMTAFSSAAQIGYIYMGLGIGGIAGYTAAMFHILAHALTKSQLFLTTPRLAEVSGDRLEFKYLQGSALKCRAAGRTFIISSLSMIGIPILAGFSSKLLFGVAAVDSGSWRTVIAVMVVLAVSSLLNAMYFIRTMVRIYTDPEREKTPDDTDGEVVTAKEPGAEQAQEPDADDEERPYEGQTTGLDYHLPMIVLTAGNVFLGLFSWVIVDLIQRGLAMF